MRELEAGAAEPLALAAHGPASLPHPNGRRLSAMLLDIAADQRRERVSIADLLAMFGNRAFGALVFIFAAPNVLPITAPGFSVLLGAPLLFLTWQLMIGRSSPWLPGVIGARSLARSDLHRLVCRLVPFLERIERTIRPRLLPLTSPQAERVIGIVGFSLAIIIFLPIPFGNMLPGLALAILGLGLLERDGLAVLLGLLAAVTGVLVVAGVLYGLAKALYVLIFANLGG